MFGQLLDVWWHVCVHTEQEQEGEGLTDTAHIEERGRREREREREQLLQRQRWKGDNMSDGRKRSKIWMHFNNIGNTNAKCRVCKVKISYRAGSANNLHRHIRTVHPSVQLQEKRQASEPATTEGASSSTATVAAASVSTSSASPQPP